MDEDVAALGARGADLWRGITAAYDLDGKPAERLLLIEACRCADRLERLDEILRGDVDTWLTFRLPRDDSGDDVRLVIDGALGEARQQQNILKQLVAALRLPDEATGKRPQQRGGARGAYKSTGTGATVTALSAIERARRASGA